MSVYGADALDIARRDAHLSQVQLWLRYFEVGGMATAIEIEAIVHGALLATDADHDRIALVLNERFSETGSSQTVPYAEDSDA